MSLPPSPVNRDTHTHTLTQVLRGSFAYSYYSFAEDEEMDAGGVRGAAGTVGRQLMRRRGNQLYTRRTTFEFLQSDLEALVEMLSDVVARKYVYPSILQPTPPVVGSLSTVSRLF